eukprot:TRINITY_DN59146_c0_g1_i1.p1 TRINITY_DN59146_c0_g1~~TRINITY_DN59146_c0_g1_i1.p1  ORF type:complete len:924 (+),score=142.76 TRINITY_DN59146_c0_g1_i1:71-2842(+)
MPRRGNSTCGGRRPCAVAGARPFLTLLVFLGLAAWVASYYKYSPGASADTTHVARGQDLAAKIVEFGTVAATTPTKAPAWKETAAVVAASSDSRGHVKSATGLHLPKIFVYNVPASSADGVTFRDAATCELEDVDSEGERNCLYGKPFQVEVAGAGQDGEALTLKLRNPWQFGLARLLDSRLRRPGFGQRVTEPSKADLLYVPIWYSWFPPGVFNTPGKCPDADTLGHMLPYLNSSTAHKHLMMVPRAPGKSALCPHWRQKGNVVPTPHTSPNSLLQEAQKLALEDGRVRDSSSLVYKGISVYSTPYPGVGSGLDEANRELLRRAASAERSRKSLVMAAVGLHGPGKEVRQRFLDECEQSSRDCVIVTGLQEDTSSNVGASGLKNPEKLFGAMLDSTFCFQPPGDTPSRKGIVDSVALGCIPVFTAAEQRHLWPWHASPEEWKQASVLLDVSQRGGSLLSQLKSFSATTVKAKRQFLEKLAARFEYRLEAGMGDALDIALNGALRATKVRSVSVADERMPRVYVYDLPAKLPDEVVLRDFSACEPLTQGSNEEVSCLFGDAFHVNLRGDRGDDDVKLRNPWQFNLAAVMHSRMLRYSNRVMDPDDADLFYIPIWYSWFPPGVWKTPGVCPRPEDLGRLLPHLNDDTARRHVLMIPKVAGRPCICQEWPQEAQDRKAAEPSPKTKTARLFERVVKLALEDGLVRDRSGLVYAGRALYSIPYAGFGSGLDKQSFVRLRNFVASSNTKRKHLAMGAAGLHGPGKAIRQAFMEECAKADDCLVVEGLKQDGKRNIGRSNLRQPEKLAAAMLESTFCFEPPGDTPSRKGIVDAVSLGCIPIFTAPEQRRLWSWHVSESEWVESSVLVEGHAPGSVKILERLRSISDSDVQRMRALLPRLAARFRYAPAEEDDDALSIALKGAWRAATI